MNEFIEEARTKFEELEDLMRELRDGVAGGREIGPVLRRMIREIHTIKGLASLAGFPTLNKAAHWLETLLELASEGELKPGEDFLNVVGDFISAMERILNSIETSGEEGDAGIDYLVTRATLLLKKSKGKGSVFASLKEKGRTYRVVLTLDSVPEKIPSWLFSIVSKLQTACEILSSSPDVEEVLKGNAELSSRFEFQVRTALDPDRLRDLLLGCEGVRSVEVVEGEEVEKIPLLIRVYFKEEAPLKAARALLILKDLRDLGKVVSVNPPEAELKNGILLGGRVLEVLIETSKRPERIKNAILAHQDVDTVEILEDFDVETLKPKNERPPSKPARAVVERPSLGEKSVRINPTVLDRLMAAVEEFLLLKEWLEEADEGDLGEIREKFKKSFEELRKTVLEMRTVSLRDVLKSLIPGIKGLARDLGKEIKVVVDGDDVRVDRGIVEVLLESLVHILNNAVVHGIESPEERIRKGKPREGTLRISLSQYSDYVEVSVSDDGRGIDLETIRKRAVEKGVVPPEKVDRLSKKEVLGLLFLPGMSSEKVASERSGRGIGLSVVWEAVRAVHGSIIVDTEQGRGTTFRIRVPYTFSVIPAYILDVGGNLYAFPSLGVLGEVRVEKALVRKLGGGYLTVAEGEVLPAVMLHDLVDFAAFPGEELSGLIFDAGKSKVVLLADRIVDKREIAVKPLREVLPPSLLGEGKLYTGITLLGGKRIVPVLDHLEILGVLGYEPGGEA
ncbi:hypothetical protein A3L09_04515 [Thermococcus profundus]|uniref:Chemotaxis protein CheA n=1 Tax=Thermococcus profundus TaxID=49899 RepID=A0A2Z2MCY8_THEPR|nr:ATP-binding protein [Thermococcus profundus]ASJ02572.1 hypothetical protein A3L09_04515 [Thermococcus profundus]